MADHVWMRHREHGGMAQLPEKAGWEALGWETTDDPPPPPIDPVLIEHQPRVAPTPQTDSDPSEEDMTEEATDDRQLG